MNPESLIFAALQSLVSGRVYRDLAPLGTAKPNITFQQVGGAGINFVDPTVPSKKNARFQVNVWATTRDAAAALSRQVEDTLRVYTALQVTVLGAPVAVFEPDIPLHGTHQDFSVWHVD